MPPLAKSGLYGAILIIGSIFLTIITAEIWLRWTDFSFYWSLSRVPDPITGWSARADTRAWQRLEGEGLVSINTEGWRDLSHDIAPAADKFRIAIIGDSFTEAVQVPLAKTYWHNLPPLLEQCSQKGGGEKIEILNFAVSGYSTAQELLVLQNKVWKYKPDLVLLAFFPGNDVVENFQELGQDAMRPYFSLEGGQLKPNLDYLDSEEYRSNSGWLGKVKFSLLANSRVIQAISRAHFLYKAEQKHAKTTKTRNKAEVTEPGVDTRLYQPPTSSDWLQAWQITEALLGRIEQEVRNNGAKLFIVTMTTGAQVHPDPEFRQFFQQRLNVQHLFYAEQRIYQFGLQNNVPVLNLAPDFQHFATQNGIWLHGFANTTFGIGHWNQNGHKLATQRIASFLCHNQELISNNNK